MSWLAALCAVAGIGCAGTDEVCGPSRGRVTQVRDGDTVVLDDGDVVRYLGIDTPERDVCYGDVAWQANARVVAGAELTLEDDVRCRDRYDRRLSYVSIAGIDVGAWLLGQGLARLEVISPNDTREAEYRRIVEEARAAGRGLWTACR